MPSALVVFLYLHGYSGKWGGSCCLQYRIPEWLKKKLNSYSKVLSETPKETSWLLLSLKRHFADTSPSGVHTQQNLTYGLFPPRSEMKNEWEIPHFHNRALRACCRGKSKNFCQFMEIKTQNWGRHAWQALPALGAGSFLSQHVPWEHLGSVLWKGSGHSQWGPVRDILGVTVFPMCNQHNTELCFGVAGEGFAAGTGISLGFHLKQVLYLTHCFLQICFAVVHRAVRFSLCWNHVIGGKPV